LSVREGTALGLKLVHAKLRTAGSSGFPKFGAIFEDFLAEAANGSRTTQDHQHESAHEHDRGTLPIRTNSPHAASVPASELNCDLIVVCALQKPELEKVMRTGTEWTALPSSPRDPHVYYQSTFTTALGKTLKVVAAAPNQMGLPASAVLATKMILRFQPKLVALVGIAAGVKQDTQGFGDILAGDQTFDSGAGKLVTDDSGRLTLRPSTDPLPIHPRLLARLRERVRTEKGLNEIQRSWQALHPRTPLKLHVGPIASGAAVVATPGPVGETLSHWRKLVGFEMEAYAVHRACSDALDPPRPFLCLKGICDFANEGKNDDWQDYAAFTAAQFCHRFIVEEWDNLGLD
jgi:nucleoside phosphorylase